MEWLVGIKFAVNAIYKSNKEKGKLMIEREAPLATGTLKPNNLNWEKPNNIREEKFEPFGKDGISFFDFLDIINPLQHIPLVATLYRKITGDEIDPASRLAGSALYGGPLGAVTSLIDIVIELNTGKDIGEHTLEMTSRNNTILENTPSMEETKIKKNPRSAANLGPDFLINKEAKKDLRSDVYKNDSNNPFLAEQRASYSTSPTALQKKIDAGINIEEKMKFVGKIQNRHATGAYSEASSLE